MRLFMWREKQKKLLGDDVMVSIGSIFRFAIGIVLSAEIIRSVLFANKVISDLSIALSIAFLFFSALYFVFRF